MTTPLKFSLMSLLVMIPLPSCNDRSGAEKAKVLQNEIEQLNKLNTDAQQVARRLQSQIEASRIEKDKLKEEKTKLEEDRESAVKELEQLKKQFENYKGQYKLSMRQRAPGMHIDDFAVNGVVYRHVTLKELTDTYVNFAHEAGAGKLSVKLLPEALQDLLGINIPAPGSGREVLAISPHRINDARATEHALSVSKVVEEKAALMRQLDDAQHKLMEANDKLRYSTSGLAPLKKFITEQEAYIAKIKGQLAQADMKVYEVRQDRPLVVPTK